MMWLFIIMLVLTVICFKRQIDNDTWLEHEHRKQKRHDEMIRRWMEGKKDSEY